MGFLSGGSSQSTSSLVSSIDFSPVIQFGSDQDSTQDKVNKQTATVSPELDDSLGLSASVGVLGGSGGMASTTRVQDEQPTGTASTGEYSGFSGLSSINPVYLGLGVAGVALIAYFSKGKKKRKK